MLTGIIIITIVLFLGGYSLIPYHVYRFRQYAKKIKHKDEKRIFLTFDDGPSAGYTPLLLDLLKKYAIKASFFTVAAFARDNPEIIQRMREEGHLICLHSLEHKDDAFIPPSVIRKNFNECFDIMASLDVDIKYFRPPWGHINLETIREIKKRGLTPVFWDVMAQDWRGDTTSEIIFDKIIRRVKGGNIICLHDGRGTDNAPSRTVAALTDALPLLLEKGFVFDTVDNYEG